MWFMRNWYYLGGVIFTALAFIVGLRPDDWLDRVTLVLIYNFMALLAHQFEEYAVPGGAPIVVNAGMYGEHKDYDRYPGNLLSSTIVNMTGWAFYLAALATPGWIWLGLATMYFGFFQVLGHGIVMNIRTKGWYNPGLATALLLHLPIGSYYIWYVTATGLATGWDYLWGFVGFIAAMILTVMLPVQTLKSRDSQYAVSPDELNRFHMADKLRARGVIDTDKPQT